jgi:hypothetical protein
VIVVEDSTGAEGEVAPAAEETGADDDGNGGDYEGMSAMLLCYATAMLR